MGAKESLAPDTLTMAKRFTIRTVPGQLELTFCKKDPIFPQSFTGANLLMPSVLLLLLLLLLIIIINFIYSLPFTLGFKVKYKYKNVGCQSPGAAGGLLESLDHRDNFPWRKEL